MASIVGRMKYELERDNPAMRQSPPQTHSRPRLWQLKLDGSPRRHPVDGNPQCNPYRRTATSRPHYTSPASASHCQFSALYEIGANGVANEIRRRFQIELSQCSGPIGLDGLGTDAERVCHLLVRPAFGDQ